MDKLHTIRNFSDGVAALPVHDRPDGMGDVEDEALTAPTTETGKTPHLWTWPCLALRPMASRFPPRRSMRTWA